MSFIVDPRPVRIVVRDVVPPEPAKLADQARRVVEVLDDLAPVELVPQPVHLAELAGRRPAEHYLLPCRGSGGEGAGREPGGSRALVLVTQGDQLVGRAVTASTMARCRSTIRGPQRDATSGSSATMAPVRTAVRSAQPGRAATVSGVSPPG